MNKVKAVVYLIHFLLIDIWARSGVYILFPHQVAVTTRNTSLVGSL